VGESGVGPWQMMEYYEALDRRVTEPNYPLILILSAKRPAPELPFARQLHWGLAEDPTSDAAIAKLVAAASQQREQALGRAHMPTGLAALDDDCVGIERDRRRCLGDAPDRHPHAASRFAKHGDPPLQRRVSEEHDDRHALFCARRDVISRGDNLAASS
jgi:hypothetical protein